MRAKKRMIVVISYVVLILVALISIFPLVYAVMIATKKPVDAFSMSFKWIYTPIFDNFKTLWIEKGFTKYFYNIKLTAQEYVCNMAVCTAEESEDVWFIANNISEPYAIREYKKRFNIEEMFRDFKSGGFNLEDTWSNDIQYTKMLYFCVCIAY